MVASRSAGVTLTVVGTGRKCGQRGTRGQGRKINRKGGTMIQQEPDIVRSQQLVNKWGDRRNLPTDADLDEVMEGAQDLQMAITTRMEALNNLTDVLKEAAKEWGPVLIGHKYQAEIEDGLCHMRAFRHLVITLRSKGDTDGQQ